MKSPASMALAMILTFAAAGCVTKVYEPGAAGHPFHKIQPGQSYGDMVRILGKPDHGHSEDRSGEEYAILMVPGWNIVESAGDFNPSSVQVYTYSGQGTITIGNNKIIRVEAR